NDGTTYFQPPKQQIETLVEGFQVFTKYDPRYLTEETQLEPIGPENTYEQRTCLHIAARTTRNEGVLQAGGGVWWGKDDPRNMSIRLATMQSQTLQCAEIVSALTGIQMTPLTTILEIISSRDILISAAVMNLQKWEDSRWIGVTDHKEKQALIAALRNQKGKTIFRGKDNEIVNKTALNEAGQCKGNL
ncbi:hypothetical protein B0H13DRAFT_1663828, partial [Mycena leptocephala]